MKTLKQIFDKHNLFITDRTKFRLIIQEWLQQKRQEMGEMYVKTPIDELLEELEGEK